MIFDNALPIAPTAASLADVDKTGLVPATPLDAAYGIGFQSSVVINAVKHDRLVKSDIILTNGQRCHGVQISDQVFGTFVHGVTRLLSSFQVDEPRASAK